MTDTPAQGPVIDVDIVSDVMCPWCIVGYRQLEQALGMTGMGARIRWHPFELNPDMPAEGQNITEHIAEKYGATPEQSKQNRDHLKALGASLGIDFAYHDDKRILNTFQAHQVLDFALSQGKQHPLKLALFQAYFTDNKNVSEPAVLADVAESVGLDRAAVEQLLADGSLAASVREKQAFWHNHGISGVPSMIFEGKYLITGAQGAENYARLMQQVAQEQAA